MYSGRKFVRACRWMVMRITMEKSGREETVNWTRLHVSSMDRSDSEVLVEQNFMNIYGEGEEER